MRRTSLSFGVHFLSLIFITAITMTAVAQPTSTQASSSHHLQEAFSSLLLTPSQTIRSCNTKKDVVHRKKKYLQGNSIISSQIIVPSQTIKSGNIGFRRQGNLFMENSQAAEDSEPSGASSSSSTKTSLLTPTTNPKNNHNQNKPRRQKRHNFKYYGDIPDVNWRAIPMDHLRSHPLYIPLPHPDTIKTLTSLEDVRIFRQDSWQWDELHLGRCTTSQAAPALGLLEPNASKTLGIPRSLQKGCMGAFYRLRQPALRTLDEMNQILCTGGNGGDKKIHRVWKKMDSSRNRRYPFAAKYMPVLTKNDLDERRADAKQFMNNISSPMRIRMKWGNSQEATAILTALNYFSKYDPGLKIKEVGMCGAGLDLNTTNIKDSSGLLIGASPDSVIQYSNGTLEVLEVKNHCPFVPVDWMKSSKAQRSKRQKLGEYRIRELPLQCSVPTAYIPQLMMEMMSCGENCKSAIMVRQTATCGAVILRLHRNDKWIEEMIYWLQRFVSDYVKKENPPPPNFFWESHRYQEFIKLTKELSEQVELVEHVRHNDVQRVLGAQGLRLPLFLD